MIWLLVSPGGFASNLLDAASIKAVHRLYNGSESTCQVDVTAASKVAVEDLFGRFLRLFNGGRATRAGIPKKKPDPW
jgi:hypothetical protein